MTLHCDNRELQTSTPLGLYKVSVKQKMETLKNQTALTVCLFNICEHVT